MQIYEIFPIYRMFLSISFAKNLLQIESTIVHANLYLILILSGIVNKRKFPDIVRLFFGDLLRLAIGNFSSNTVTAPDGLKGKKMSEVSMKSRMPQPPTQQRPCNRFMAVFIAK